MGESKDAAAAKGQGGVFDGLESCGVKDLGGLDLFTDSAEEGKRPGWKKKPEVKEINPADYVFLRKFDCPVCGSEFMSSQVRSSKVKMTGSDLDLKPLYTPFSPLRYDAVVCPMCGYAALTTYFNAVSEKQREAIKEKITPNFIYNEYPLAFSVDDALGRHKLALLCAVVKKVKASEKAILCLKMAWLCREKPDKSQEELAFIKNAMDGFVIALQKENLPIYGMDGPTVWYMMGELSRRLGKIDNALQYLSKVIVNPAASNRLKDKARDVRDLIKDDKTRDGQKQE
jgi:uncharacterized protein (DUF2225 family)